MSKEITVEYGAFDSVSDKYYYPRGIEYAFRQQAKGAYPMPVKVVPYDGVKDTALGGAVRSPYKPPPNIETLGEGVKRANELGMSFKVALNGGLQIPGIIDLVNDPRFRTDLRVLELLAEEGAKNTVQNMVAIYRDELLEVVKKLFPNLIVAASTIRYAVPRSEEEKEAKYREDLAVFDEVVPLNQDTTARFLTRFKDDADKLVVFPFLVCGQTDLSACQAHYTDLYSGLDNRHKPNPNKDCRKCKGPTLFAREDDLKAVIGMGVNKFKIARNDASKGLSLGTKAIAEVCYSIQQRILLEAKRAKRIAKES